MKTPPKFIVAIGASAGGLSALFDFFDNTLPDGVSYVITTHLHPHQKSELAGLVQKHSTIKVCEVTSNVLIQPNTVYVMPENKVMSIDNGRLVLVKRDLSIKINMAIDIFFNSLSKDVLFQKIAIILSGMGEDGTEGVKAIAGNGGYIIAQEPGSAGEDSMPLGIITSGRANQILHPREMPQAIVEYVSHFN